VSAENKRHLFALENALGLQRSTWVSLPYRGNDDLTTRSGPECHKSAMPFAQGTAWALLSDAVPTARSLTNVGFGARKGEHLLGRVRIDWLMTSIRLLFLPFVLLHGQTTNPLELIKQPTPPAKERIAYGKDSLQFGELRCRRVTDRFRSRFLFMAGAGRSRWEIFRSR